MNREVKADPLPVLDIIDRLLTKGWAIVCRDKVFYLLNPAGGVELTGTSYRRLLCNILFAENLE